MHSLVASLYLQLNMGDSERPGNICHKIRYDSVQDLEAFTCILFGHHVTCCLVGMQERLVLVCGSC